MRQHDIKCAYYPNWQQHHQHEKHESSLPKQRQQSSPSKDHCNAIPAQLACLYFFIFRPNAKRYATTSPHFLHLHASFCSFSRPNSWAHLTHTWTRRGVQIHNTWLSDLYCDTFLLIIKRFVQVKDHTTVRLIITLFHPQFFNVLNFDKF